MKYQDFSKLIRIANRETQFLSGTYRKNENIRKIIETADEDTIAFACLALEDYTLLAFTILHELVKKEDWPPIPEYYRGRIPVIQACWQYWALEKKHVQARHDSSAYWVEDKYGNRGNWH